MKKVAILQSNYIPWKGYFDLIAYVDEFIIYDEMQYTKNDWRNRNLIKGANGVSWITIPVGSNLNRKIKDVKFNSQKWRSTHCKTITSNYRKSPYFEEIYSLIEPIILNENITTLTELNVTLIQEICNYLNIKTKISFCWDYGLIDGQTDRLVDLCMKANATIYVSGPSAKDYLQENLFTDAGIQLEWLNYQGYPEYRQLWGEFEHAVTILDLLFNCGKDSHKYMRYINDPL